MSRIMEKFYSQMNEDSKKMREAIADYNTFMFYAMNVKGMDYETARYCWRHRDD